jgi:hypothetical protein
MHEQRCCASSLTKPQSYLEVSVSKLLPQTTGKIRRIFDLQMSAKLGEILVRENLISPQHLREALDYQREHGGRLGFNLVKLGLVSDDMITCLSFPANTASLPSIWTCSISRRTVLRLIPQEVAQKHSGPSPLPGRGNADSCDG